MITSQPVVVLQVWTQRVGVLEHFVKDVLQRLGLLNEYIASQVSHHVVPSVFDLRHASIARVRHVKEVGDFVLDPPVFFDFKELSYQQDNLSTLYLTSVFDFRESGKSFRE